MKAVPEGGTLGDVFASYRRQTGKPHPEDKDYINPPPALMHLWEWFWEIAQGRTLAEGTQMPLSSVEIRAWCDLAGLRLEIWELRGIRALDACYLRVAAEKFV